jgi:outer membrane protein assembly factor BamA
MKIAGGWVDARGVYGKKGYLKVLFKPEPEFDDTRQLVTFQVAVTEGPQYRMGQVTIAGLPEYEAGRVKAAWGLRAGEVFDSSYITEFMNKVMREKLIGQTGVLKVGQEYKRDDQRLIVDVVVKFGRQGP